MARVEITETVIDHRGNAMHNVSVQVNTRAGAATTVYAAETGSTELANPLTTDSAGRIDGWLEEGSYTLVVAATDFTQSYSQPIEAIAAASTQTDSRVDALERGHYFVTVTPDDSGAAAANTTAIDTALAEAEAAGGGIVHIPYPGEIYTNGGHDIGPGVQVWGLGLCTTMVNRGATYCFRLSDETSARPTVGLKRIKVSGSLSGVAAVSGGIGVEISNGYGYDIEEVWVDGFTTSGVGWKFHNVAGTIEWTGGHHIRHVAAVNCNKCVQFIADADAEEWFGEIDIDHILIQPAASQVGISYGLSHFYNSRIRGSIFYAGNDAVGIDIATADAKVRSGSFFDIRGEIGAQTGCKRIRFSAAGQFDATGKILITNAIVPDDLTGGGVFNFVEDELSYYEAVNYHDRTIASAGTISIPGGASVFNVTGTTTITNINSSWEGRVVTLKFASAITVATSGNIDMATPFVGAAGDTLTLAHLAGVWYRVAADVSKPLVGAATTSAGFGAAQTVKARSVGTEAAFFQRFSSGQTAEILQVGDESGNSYGGFKENGYFYTRKIAAPADAELDANDLAIWFDSSNGASKVKFKGKSANGTVVTGEVALA